MKEDKIECKGGRLIEYINNAPKNTYIYRQMSSIEMLEVLGEVEAKTGVRLPNMFIDFVANLD